MRFLKNLEYTVFGIDFFLNMSYTSSRRAMQSKFMCVKCLSDGELPKDEKRNLAVRELLLAATEDK